MKNQSRENEKIAVSDVFRHRHEKHFDSSEEKWSSQSNFKTKRPLNKNEK